MPKFIDLTGHKIGRLTVSYRAENNKYGNTMWHCVCDCGNEKDVLSSTLLSGHAKSCGCYKTEHLKSQSRRAMNTKHGESFTRLYRIWAGMIYRCMNPNSKDYPDYGGRGITVCREWRESYIKFRDWAKASGYEDRLTVDRKDNDRGYSADNCRWATAAQQCENRRPARRKRCECNECR